MAEYSGCSALPPPPFSYGGCSESDGQTAEIGAHRGISGFHLCAAMIRGNIAIPDKDPKSWRSRGRKLKPLRAVLTIIAIIEGVKSPQEDQAREAPEADHGRGVERMPER
jgi:hypothetical protein